ncbi:FecR family protein [Alcanivoracaceae bacterium MT1]
MDSEDQEQVRQQARAWLRRLVSGQATEQDAREFKDWYHANPGHARAFREARGTWRQLGEAGGAWRQQSQDGMAVPPRVSRRTVLTMVAGGTGLAAASLLAVHPPLGLWPSISELGADYRTAVGEQRSLSLPGEIDALMNTRTSLSVTASGEGKRIELIAGQVALQRRGGGRPVEVAAGAGLIELGEADIEVRLLAKGACLSCTRGRVRLHHAAGDREVLKNQQVRYDQHGVRPPAPVDPVAVVAWRSGILLFRETPVSEVVGEINRYRPGKVILLDESLGRRRLSGRFDIGQLDVALTQIERLLAVPVRRLSAGLVLIG